MSGTAPTPGPTLPGRIVLGGYSLDAEGDGPEAGTGLRVLDLEPGRARAGDAAYARVGHEALLSPTWVEPHPTRPWLVSVGEAAPSELVCTGFAADGTLTVLGRQTTGGDFGCHLALSADGRQVVVAHYGSGTVESYALADDGGLTGPLDAYRSSAPLGPVTDRQDAPHAHQVVLDPWRGDELLVCDLGTDRIHRLRLHPDGRLTEAGPSVVMAPGSGPRHLVVTESALVVACELGVELWLARRTVDGWEPTQTLPTTRSSAAERAASDAPVLPSEIRLVDDHVLVATRGVDRLAAFALDRAAATVTFVAEVSCRGRHPRDLVVVDGGVWVANQWSDEVIVLDLAAVLAGRDDEPVLRLSTPRPACVVRLEVATAS